MSQGPGIEQFAVRTAITVFSLGMLVFLTGCATAVVRTAVPIALADTVDVVGMTRVRQWGDAEILDFDELVAERGQQIATKRPELAAKSRHTASYLALSGGGSDGAFGAGFLNGWTASGTRPEFEVVAGVSAGALIAPFAFLGPEYDDEVAEVFTQNSTEDLLTPRVLAGLLGGPAVSSSEPLAKLIAKHVDRQFLEKVAVQHERGRRLLVGTTNLDAERPAVWDMGRIATRRTDQALQLFRRVLLASASIPGVFPPVFVEVESDGQLYQEMHVDGGTTDNAFLLPAHLDLSQIGNGNVRRWRRELYVLVNAKTDPTPEAVEATTVGIAGRSINTLIRQQTEGDVLKLYLRAQKNNIGFKLASVPKTFQVKAEEPFDKNYMQALYKVGYEAASQGYQWSDQPPYL